MRFPTEEVLACLLARATGPLKSLELPPPDAKQAWVLTGFLDEVQEAIWMDHGIEIADYLDTSRPMDCYHSSEDAADYASSGELQDLEF